MDAGTFVLQVGGRIGGVFGWRRGGGRVSREGVDVCACVRGAWIASVF